MKLLTLNFLTCAVKSCKSTSSSFPLHPKDCELVSDTLESDPKLLFNILPRLDWSALSTTASEVHTLCPASCANKINNVKLGFPALPPSAPTQEELGADQKLFQDLHTLLLETHINEGSLVCANCGHSYNIKEGIANFLLPNHLV